MWGANIESLEQGTGSFENKRETGNKKKVCNLKQKNLRKAQSTTHTDEADKLKAIYNVNGERKANSNPNMHSTYRQKTLLKDPIPVSNHLNTFFESISDRTLTDAKLRKIIYN